MRVLRPGTPFTLGDLTFLPVEKVDRWEANGPGGFWHWCSKEPAAVIVKNPRCFTILSLEGEDWSWGEAMKMVPRLKEALEALERMESGDVPNLRT